MADTYSNRSFFVKLLILAVGILFLVRLIHLQLFDSSLKAAANDNALRHIVQYPARGLIYDRNGELLVYNDAVYDIMVVPAELKKAENFDTLLF